MSKQKATHSGTCQVCGHFQKLPNNRLSLHGYTVEWNCFNGQCWGSKHQPFELGKDLIELSIERAKEDKQHTEDFATKLEQEKFPAKVWLHLYRTSWNKALNGYHWQEFDASEIIFEGVFFKAPTGKKLDGQTPFMQQHNISGVRSHHDLNKLRAKDVRNRVAQLERYIGWQKHRIKDWKPEPEKLVAVVAKVVDPNKPKRRTSAWGHARRMMRRSKN